MYMHLTFHDGSNPSVAYNKSAEAVKRIYKQWSKGHGVPLEWLARIDVFSSAIDSLRVYTVSGGGFMVAWKDEHKVEHFSKRYERFGNAVNALGRMSAKMQKPLKGVLSWAGPRIAALHRATEAPIIISGKTPTRKPRKAR